MEGNAADYQGQYYLYTEDGNVKVQYVVAGAVPEPATATLSLLGLASLMLRRRRLTFHTLSFFLNSLYAHAYRLFFFRQ